MSDTNRTIVHALDELRAVEQSQNVLLAQILGKLQELIDLEKKGK